MRNINKYLIFIIFGFLLSGCSKRIQLNKVVIIKSNFREMKGYTLSYELDNAKDYNGKIKLLAYMDGKQIKKLFIGGRKIKINIKVVQRSLPFSFISGYSIKGRVKLVPSDMKGTIYSIPFTVYVNSWISANIWIIYLILSVITILFFINYGFYFFKVAPRGTVNFIVPMSGPWYIYPKSRIFHFNRNKYSIGTGEKDQIPSVIKTTRKNKKKGKTDDHFKELHPGQFRLVYKRDIRNKKNLTAELKSNKFFFVKETDINVRTANYTDTGDLEKAMLELKGFQYVRKYVLKSNIKYHLIVSTGLEFEIEIT